MIKGAIFDMDGTLLDTMPMWSALGEIFLAKKNIKPREGLREDLLPMSQRQSAKYFIEKYNVQGSVDEVQAEINDMVRDYYLYNAPLKNGAKELLCKLYEKGVKICIATATDIDMARAALERNGLYCYIDKIFACDSIGKGKEEPDIFLMARDFLGTETEETYVFEDALYAIKTAKSLGLKTVAVYDEASQWQNEEIKKTADMYFKSINDMVSVF